jgi:hypothetical protein
MSPLSPSDLFCCFDKDKLVYFNHKDMVTLEHELVVYIDNLLHDARFSSLDSITDVAKLMVDTRKHLSYPFVCLPLSLDFIWLIMCFCLTCNNNYMEDYEVHWHI